MYRIARAIQATVVNQPTTILHDVIHRVAQEVRHYQISKKSYYIVLNTAYMRLDFVVKLKYQYNLSVSIKFALTMPDAQ